MIIKNIFSFIKIFPFRRKYRKKTKKTYRLVLEFYGLKTEVNDILMLNEKLLDPKSEWATYFYVFEELKKPEANLAEVDLAEIIIKDKKHILKRVYG